MKQKNKVKRLKDRQADYNTMIKKDPKSVYSFKRPGSIKG